MNIDIISEEKMQATERTKVDFAVTFTEKATPSRADIQAAIAKKQKVKPQQVMVHSVGNQFGNTSANSTAYVYDSVEAAAKFEPKYVVKRNEVPEPKVEEKPAEEAK